MPFCNKCDEFYFSSEVKSHKCCMWEFKHEYYGDDWVEKCFPTHWDHGMVAEKLGNKNFHDDPCCLDSYEFDVLVKSPDGEVQRIIVTGEPDISWNTQEKPQESEERDG